MTRRAWMTIAALVFLAGCAAEGESTFAEVVVDATPVVRQRARALEVIALAEPEGRLLLSEVARVPQDVEFPVRLVFSPTGPGEDHVFHVIARAFEDELGEGEMLAGQLLLGGFSHSGWVRFDMTLDETDEMGASNARGEQP